MGGGGHGQRTGQAVPQGALLREGTFVVRQGGFAECVEVTSEETGRRYAAKIIGKDSLSKGTAKEKLQSEIVIHKSMRHRHIVQFEHFFEDH